MISLRMDGGKATKGTKSIVRNAHDAQPRSNHPLASDTGIPAHFARRTDLTAHNSQHRRHRLGAPESRDKRTIPVGVHPNRRPGSQQASKHEVQKLPKPSHLHHPSIAHLTLFFICSNKLCNSKHLSVHD